LEAFFAEIDLEAAEIGDGNDKVCIKSELLPI